MPYVGERAARLFYDDACGPCRFLARAAVGVSRHRIEATPLDAAAADEPLGALSPETRYGSAHLSLDGALRSGDSVPAPLLGLTLGASWETVVRRVPFLDRSLRRFYLRLWTARRTRGCGAR
jgi:hypothetical protein